MLAGEIKLAGAHPVVLERRPEPTELPKANGLGGRIVDLLDYRGLLERMGESFPVPSWRFGPVTVPLSRPMRVLLIQQPKLERLLTERALELGVEIRRGQAVTGLSQDDDGVTIEVGGGDPVRARYLVGCDGGHSLVRELAGIGFPGTTEKEVLRMGHFAVDQAPAESDWVRTPYGSAIVTSLQPGVAIIGVREETSVDMGTPLTVPELQEAYLRVTGEELQCGEPIWLSRTVQQARLATTYRAGRVFLAGDAAHLFPAGGSALNVGMLDAADLGWKLAAQVRGQAPPGLLDTYHAERHQVGARTLAQTRAQAFLHQCTDDDVRDLMGELLGSAEPARTVSELLYGADGTFLPASPASGRSGRAVLLANSPTAVAAAQPYPVDVIEGEGDAVLVRPDGIVGWSGAADGVEEALRQIFLPSAS